MSASSCTMLPSYMQPNMCRTVCPLTPRIAKNSKEETYCYTLHNEKEENKRECPLSTRTMQHNQPPWPLSKGSGFELRGDLYIAQVIMLIMLNETETYANLPEHAMHGYVCNNAMNTCSGHVIHLCASPPPRGPMQLRPPQFTRQGRRALLARHPRRRGCWTVLMLPVLKVPSEREARGSGRESDKKSKKRKYPYTEWNEKEQRWRRKKNYVFENSWE